MPHLFPNLGGTPRNTSAYIPVEDLQVPWKSTEGMLLLFVGETEITFKRVPRTRNIVVTERPPWQNPVYYVKECTICTLVTLDPVP